ncbi:MAG: pilin [Xanthomonadales bacterium]|nr:pilin [Xanthomonadales bacterium]
MVTLLGVAGCSNHSDDRARSEVFDAMSGATEARLFVTQLYMMEGSFPDGDDIASMQLMPPGGDRYTRKIEPGTGVITITFTDAAAGPIRGKSLRIEPLDQAGDLDWRCSSDDLDEEFVPAVCRGHSG